MDIEEISRESLTHLARLNDSYKRIIAFLNWMRDRAEVRSEEKLLRYS
jgi:hypothetical protein